MIDNLKKTLIKKVTLFLIVFSLLLSLGILLYNYMIIEERVDQLVQKESIDLISLFQSFNKNYNKENIKTLEEKILEKLQQGNISYVKFYTLKLEEIQTINSLEQSKHISIQELLDQTNDSVLNLGWSKISLEIAIPIIDITKQEILGYLTLEYTVPKNELSQIKSEIIISILFSLMIVLVTTLFLYPMMFSMNSSLIDYTNQLISSRLETLMAFGKAISQRDNDTGAHNYRVTLYAIAIAEELGLSISYKRDLIRGSFLHDIGKIGISDNILLKPGKLTEEEFETMKSHVTKGAEIIENISWLSGAKDVVLYHHEKYDGSGYPYGLKGDDIPVNAAIFAIADVFDALTSERPYKKPFSYEKSIEIISQESGTHFNPLFVEAFKKISKKLYLTISSLNNEEELKELLLKQINKYIPES
jgi:putative nucleotidyltransferase with HDIG domain